jgi:hypothetical protein
VARAQDRATVGRVVLTPQLAQGQA